MLTNLLATLMEALMHAGLVQTMKAILLLLRKSSFIFYRCLTVFLFLFFLQTQNVPCG